ncbi:FecR family protein [Niabella aurantiaca]|uniref:FecR family protein n=1 Tax=Niabella aurantiaca TaxID=379900 RepID=UPI00036FC40D|nr:FecR family protein [Niabella aurantiaca]
MTYTVEELVIDDSFIAYCTQQHPRDIAFWDDYLLKHPEELITLEEARKLVLGLKYMLQQKQNELSATRDSSEHALYVASGENSSAPTYKTTPALHPGTGWKKWAVVAAATLILVIGGLFLRSREVAKQPLPVAKTGAASGETVSSRTGEHKTIVLPDSTKVILNAGSRLLVSKTFGSRDRNVYLTGEALFTVAHNKELPFIVHVAKYKIRAVGTRFNVKAYTNDRYSETSLLEGKVQILLPRGNNDIVYKTLEVNQKFVMDIPGTDSLEHTVPAKPVIVPLAYHDSSQNVETAWVDDLLIFEDQPLYEIRNILERKYGVTINIASNEVAHYRYTAAFQHEQIEEVLKALQLSYAFSYKKDGNQITIYK